MTEKLLTKWVNRSVFVKAILYMIMAGVIQNLQDILIQFFISRKLGADGLTAYGLAYPLLSLMIGVSSFIVVGVHTVCSRDMGANEPKKASAHLNAGLTWGFILMSVLMLICIVFRSPLIMALGGSEVPPELAEMAMDALALGTCSGPGLCVICLMLTFLYFDRNRKRSIALGMITIATQFAAEALVSGFLPTMKGVILGYILGTYLSMAFIFIHLRRGAWNTETPFEHLRPSFDLKPALISFQTGLPELSAWILYVLFAIVRNVFILSISTKEAIAVATMAEGINQVGELVMSAASDATLALAGAAFGSGSLKRYKKDVSLVFRQTAVIAIAAGLIQAAMVVPVVRLMLDGEGAGVHQMAVTALLMESITLTFYIVNNVFISTYEATGRLRYAHVNYALEYLVLPLALMVLLGKCFGITGVWISHPVSEALLLLYNIFLTWKTCGHFPRRAEDFGFLQPGQMPNEQGVGTV